MAGVPRGERIRARIAAEYRPLEDIISDPPDLLVVTGSNPIESRIEDEPYWSDLHGLLRSASENVPAMVLSCLSAHAALAVFDGVERTTLPAKCTGVFAQEADPTHPLAAGMPEMRPSSCRIRGSTPCPSRQWPPPVTRWPCSRGRSAGVWSRRRWASARSCWSRPIRSTRRASCANTSGTCGATSATGATNCLVSPQIARPAGPGRAPPAARAGGRRRAEPSPGRRLPFDDICVRAPWPWRGAAQRLYANLLGTIREKERLSHARRHHRHPRRLHSDGTRAVAVPSTRRWPTTSSTPPTPVPCSTWRRPASTTTGSTTRR